METTELAWWKAIIAVESPIIKWTSPTRLFNLLMETSELLVLKAIPVVGLLSWNRKHCFSLTNHHQCPPVQLFVMEMHTKAYSSQWQAHKNLNGSVSTLNFSLGSQGRWRGSSIPTWSAAILQTKWIQVYLPTQYFTQSCWSLQLSSSSGRNEWLGCSSSWRIYNRNLAFAHIIVKLVVRQLKLVKASRPSLQNY